MDPVTGERLPVGPAGDVEGGGVVRAVEGRVSGDEGAVPEEKSIGNNGIKENISADDAV